MTNAVRENLPENYRLQIADDLRRSLKDPYSVRDAEITLPATGFIGILNGFQGVLVCVRLNAKNSFGGYTGLQVYQYAFKSKVMGHRRKYACLPRQGLFPI